MESLFAHATSKPLDAFGAANQRLSLCIHRLDETAINLRASAASLRRLAAALRLISTGNAPPTAYTAL